MNIMAENWMKSCRTWMRSNNSYNMRSCWYFENNDSVNDSDVVNPRNRSHRFQTWGKRCIKGGFWFIVFFLSILIAAFLLTFFLTPETGRLIWLVIIGTFLSCGILFLTLITLWLSRIKKKYINRQGYKYKGV